jgi:hypothetical protein
MSYSIRNRPVKIGWARPPPPIPASLATAISQGASRSIYMGMFYDTYHCLVLISPLNIFIHL